VSTKVNSDRIQNDTTIGADIRRIEGRSGGLPPAGAAERGSRRSDTGRGL
jgi:hypothetical protein